MKRIEGAQSRRKSSFRADGGSAGVDRVAPHGRIVELDSIRGLAAVSVLIFHAINPSWLPFGWAAVELFFVLSGYLITTIILRNGASPGFLRNFYIRRGLRTWPIYYLVIALLVALGPILPRPSAWQSLPSPLESSA